MTTTSSNSQPADAGTLKEALGRIPSGIFVAGAGTGAGRRGLLCSFVEQAGFSPPMIMLAVGRGRALGEMLAAGHPFGLNILGRDARDLMAAFSRPAEGDPFAGLELLPNAENLPELAASLAFLACRPCGAMDAGDHVVHVAEVFAGRLHGTGGEPMIRLRKNGFSY